MYRREFADRDSSGRPLQLFFYIILRKRCNQCIELLDVTYCTHTEKYELHPDYQDRDCRKRNYLAFYCDHADRG